MLDEDKAALTKQFPELSVRENCNYLAFNSSVSEFRKVLAALKNEFGYTFLANLTAVDWDTPEQRFSVVYVLFNMESCEYVGVNVVCEDSENPEIDSVVDLWPAADWHERETYDMFGIKFNNHPELKRILMWDSYPYHPLRKDFPLAGKPTEFPSDDVRERMGTSVKPAPMAGGPFTAGTCGAMSAREPRAKDQSWNEKKEKPSEK
jgi:NADH-quinone oxidoreductase subunit C